MIRSVKCLIHILSLDSTKLRVDSVESTDTGIEVGSVQLM